MDESATFELIRTLTELPGPTGDEAPVQAWIAERWAQIASDIRTTRVNNVLAKVGGSGPRLAIMGHADEICFSVKSISDEGFLHIWPYYMDTRGYPPRWITPIGHPAAVMTSKGDLVHGFFATPSGHVVPHTEPLPRLGWNDWFIDIGVSSCDEAEALDIHIGDHVIWNPKTTRLGAYNIVGKAMDDRAALAIVTMAGERLAGRNDLTYEVWMVSTVQEENGLIGAQSVFDEMPFDLCLNLDVGLTGDIPGVDARDFPSKLGAGAMVVFQDGMVHYSRALSDALVATAAAGEIPVQRAIFQQYGSDAGAMIRRGVESALIAYPTRYTHSPIEMVDERDIEACVDLIVAWCTTARY
jgi:putative aminopeptidase FrvX